MDPGRRKKGGVLKLVLIIIFLLIVLAGTTVFMYFQNLGEPYDSGNKEFISVVIPEGTTASGISEILDENGIVGSARDFSIYSRIHKLSGKYQAGSYNLSPSMPMKEIAEILSTGKVNDIDVTIPEGYTEYDTAKVFAKKGLVDEKKFIKALESGKFKKDYDFLSGIKDKTHMLEGYLAPMTYTVRPGTSEDEIIRMMLDHYKTIFTPEMRKRAKKLKMSEHDIVTVASIIEKECADVGDQKIVASVIYNRLDIDMALQMDSTIQYVLGLDGKRKKDLLNKDTEIESPYNTYTNTGLPAGPICSPGASAIEAALYPADTDYMYFVLSDELDGKMAFSVEYDDFLKDKDAYYKALEEAGE